MPPPRENTTILERDVISHEPTLITGRPVRSPRSNLGFNLRTSPPSQACETHRRTRATGARARSAGKPEAVVARRLPGGALLVTLLGTSATATHRCVPRRSSARLFSERDSRPRAAPRPIPIARARASLPRRRPSALTHPSLVVVFQGRPARARATKRHHADRGLHRQVSQRQVHGRLHRVDVHVRHPRLPPPRRLDASTPSRAVAPPSRDLRFVFLVASD